MKFKYAQIGNTIHAYSETHPIHCEATNLREAANKLRDQFNSLYHLNIEYKDIVLEREERKWWNSNSIR